MVLLDQELGTLGWGRAGMAGSRTSSGVPRGLGNHLWD